MSKSYESFKTLPVSLQKEAIREGERRLDAQLVVASASDQRALNWSALLVAAVTASIAGAIAMFSKEEPDNLVAMILLLLAGALLGAATKAIGTTTPTEFCMPGNKPGSWLPENWEGECLGAEHEKEAQARMEQAAQMTEHIEQNRQAASVRAKGLKASFNIASSAIGLGALALVGVLLWRVIIQ